MKLSSRFSPLFILLVVLLHQYLLLFTPFKEPFSSLSPGAIISVKLSSHSHLLLFIPSWFFYTNLLFFLLHLKHFFPFSSGKLSSRFLLSSSPLQFFYTNLLVFLHHSKHLFLSLSLSPGAIILVKLSSNSLLLLFILLVVLPHQSPLLSTPFKVPFYLPSEAMIPVKLSSTNKTVSSW